MPFHSLGVFQEAPYVQKRKVLKDFLSIVYIQLIVIWLYQLSVQIKIFFFQLDCRWFYLL